MTTARASSPRPRNLTDAVKARQARRGVDSSDARHRPGAPRAGAQRHGQARRASARRGSEEQAAGAQSRSPESGSGGSLLSRLLTPLKWLGRKVSDALEGLLSEDAGLLSEHGGQLKKLGAMLAAGWLAKRLPGPLGSLTRWLASGLSGDRGFGFWWLAVTLGIALAVGALIALLISPVAALIALLVVGIWMLVRHARNDKDDDRSGDKDDGRSDDRDEGRTDTPHDDAGVDSEREPTAAPASA